MTPEHFLIIAPNWVGDMVLAQSLLKTLRARHPDAAITVLGPQWTRALTARMPEVTDSVTAALRHGRLDALQRWRIARLLRRRRFTHAIVLPNSFKSALIPFLAGVPRRTGYRGEMRWGLLNDVRRLDPEQAPMTVQRFVALGLAPGQSTPPDEVPTPALTSPAGAGRRTLSRLGLKQADAPVLALCPGAEYGPAKRWPPEHFAQVARSARARGWTVLLLGSANDIGTSAEICRHAGDACLDLTGRTRLDEAIDLLALSEAVVTNDSGLMHVAAALDRNVVALFGSSSAARTPPLGRRSRVLSLELECSPCFERECPLGHLKCLRDLEPNRVVEILDAL